MPDNSPLPGANRRFANIQALRGIAVLMVLLRHCSVYENRYGVGALPGGDWWTGSFGVDLFFAISGFVMVSVSTGKPRGPLNFLWRRASRVYPLYWCVSLVVLGIYLFARHTMKHASAGQDPDMLRSFLLLPQQYMPLVGQGWSLIHEMYFYLVFAIILALPRLAMFPLLGGWAIAVIVSRLLVPEGSGPTVALVTHPLTLEFVMGCFAALAAQRFGRFGWTALATATTAWIATAFMDDFTVRPWTRALWWGIPAAMVVYGAAAIEAKGLTFLPSLVRLGDASYSLYLTHILATNPLGGLYWRFIPPGVLANAIGVVTMSAAAIAVAAITYRLVERPLLKVGRILPCSRWPLWYEKRQRQAGASRVPALEGVEA